MLANISWATPASTTTTNIPIFDKTPYLNKSAENSNMLTLQDILLHLESALNDKDWEAIELLKEEVEYQLEQDQYDQGYDQFVDDEE